MWKTHLLVAVVAIVVLGGFGVGRSVLGHTGNECGGGYAPRPGPPIPPPPSPQAPPPPPPGPDPAAKGVTNGNGSGAPTTPGATPSPGTPTTGGMRGSGPTTGRRSRDEVVDRWEFWWEANQDSYLLVRVDATTTTTTTASAFAGRVRAAPSTRRVTSTEVRSRILPALLAALSEKEAAIADSAALALGNIVTPNEANLALTPLVRALDHPEITVREAAATALGVVGSVDAVPTLRALLLDTDEGRRLTAHPAGVEERVRAGAAAALGLIGDPATIPDLERSIEPAVSGSSRSVAQLALLSLGCVRGGATEVVAFLLRTMARRDLDHVVVAHAPIALAHLAATPEGESAARSALGALVNALAGDKTDTQMRRSAAVALGRLARVEDEEAVAALEALVSRGTDGPARSLALIALAEIGARDADVARHGEAHAALERFLLGQFVAPPRASLKPYAALALGIWGRNEALTAEARDRAITKLVEHFDSERSPSSRGAIALALGLLGTQRSVEPLALAFAEARDVSFRGYLALALGLLRARDRSDLLRAELERPVLDPHFEAQLARGLRLMGDRRAIAPLMARLARATTFVELGADVQALGLVGDGSAVEPLVALVADAKAPAARRGGAAEALGLLARKGELPWNVPFLASSNYWARSTALADLASRL